jgi:UPF0716 protein FxsA
MRLLAVFLLVPIVEIALFIQVGGWIGLWPTIGLVLLAAIAGMMIVRSQGLGAVRRLQASVAEGRDPVGPMAHGALILLAGLLLLTPGFFTDALGLALLLPPVRSWVIRKASARVTMVAGARGAWSTGRQPPTGETVEADYIVISEESRDDPSPRRERGTGSAWTRPPL